MNLPLDVLEHIADKLVDDAVPPLEDILEYKSEFWGPHQRCTEAQSRLSLVMLGYSYKPAPRKRYLKTFCLVSRECRQAALKHLFYTIEITAIAQLHRLLDILCVFRNHQYAETPISITLLPRPHVFIRRLTLWPAVGFQSKFNISSYMLFLDYELPKLLNLLAGSDCNLQGLRIVASKAMPEEWPYLASSLRKSIRNLIQQPTMRIVSFVNIKNLPNYIFRRLEIAALQLKYTRPYTELHHNHPYKHLCAEDGAEVHDAERLERLPFLPKFEYFRADHDFGDLMSDQNAGSASGWRPGILKRLKGYTITVRPYYRDNAKILDLAAGSEMKVLKLITRETHPVGGFQPRPPPRDIFNLGRYPKLEKAILVRNMSSGAVDGLAPEAKMLDEGDPCFNLHTLEFRILYWGYRSDQCINYLVDHGDSRNSWSRLVSVLGSGKYPALRRVRCNITGRIRTYKTTQEEERMRVAIEGLFERLLVSPSCEVQLELNICVKTQEHTHFQSPDGSEWDGIGVVVDVFKVLATYELLDIKITTLNKSAAFVCSSFSCTDLSKFVTGTRENHSGMHLPLNVLEHIADKLTNDAIPPLENILEHKSEFWGHHQHGNETQPTLCSIMLGHSFTPRPSREVLKMFCLVSRECRQAALKHLYHTIEWTTVTKLYALLDVLCGSSKDDDGDGMPILSTLLPRPHIFIRRLTLSLPIAAFRYTSSVSSYSPLLDDRLPKLLDLLADSDCNLEGLRLIASKVVPIEWSHLTASLRTSIRNLIQQPAVRIVSFVNIKNLPTYIFRGLEITALQLKYTKPYTELHRNHPYRHLHAEDDAEVRDAERLEHLPLLPKLEYFRSDHDFDDLMGGRNAGSASSWRPGILKHLKSCTITVRPYYRDDARILNLAAGSEMKTLKLIMRGICCFPFSSGVTCGDPDLCLETHTVGGFQPLPASNDVFNLGRFPNLEKVTIVRNLNSSSRSAEGLAPEAKMLDEGDACARLHTLNFRLLYTGYRTSLCKNYLIDHADSRQSWTRLVQALVSGKYPALRCVRFDITTRIKARMVQDIVKEENRMRAAIKGFFERVLVSGSCEVKLELNICVKRQKHPHVQSPDGSEWEESDDDK